MGHLDVIAARRVKGFVSTVPQIDTNSSAETIRRLEPVEARVGWLGEADAELIETCGLLHVEHAEGAHHEELVLDFFTLLVRALTGDRLPENDLHCFLTL